MLQEICKRTLKYSYICISEYDQSIEPFKFKLEGKKKHFKHSSSSENQKNLPGGESNPGLPRDRRGYSPLYYRGIGCVKFKLNGFCNGETSFITLKQNNFKTLLTMKAKLTDINFLQCGNNLP